MGTLPLLLLTTGLSLFSAVRAMMPPLIPAHPDELLGKWYINLWAGNLPIPQWRLAYPLPPFLLVRNDLKELEFRMNITKPIGCIQFKLSLFPGDIPGTFKTWWKHMIYISFLPGNRFAIAYYKGLRNYQFQHIMMLMGRYQKVNLDSRKLFQEFVASKLPKTTNIIKPEQTKACMLAKES